MREQVTWTELEEQRRLYWAIFVLDRTIALGNRNQFAAAEPPGAAALPADDAAWVSTPASSHCQGLYHALGSE